MGEDERVGETIRIKGPTALETYNYVNTADDAKGGEELKRPDVPVRGEKEHMPVANDLEA